MTGDLTRGRPIKLIFRFYIPVCLCNLLQQIYNIADTVIVGRMVNANALAAVGSTGSIMFLFLGFLSGATAGCAVPISSSFGAGQYEQMRKYVAQSVYFTLIISLALMGVGLPLTNIILTLMRYPDEIFGYARQYLIFTFIGTVCLAFYNLTANLLRAVGNSGTPLVSLAVAAVINVTLNIVFVKIGLAVVGVALATMISQFLSALFCAVFIYFRFPLLFPKRGEWRVRWGMLRRMAGIALPMGFQSSVISLGTIVLQSVINTLGTVYVTAVSTATKVATIFQIGLMDSLGTAMVPYCSQNLGAQKIEHIREGTRGAWKIMIPVLTVTCLSFWFLGGRLTSLFIKPSEADYNQIIDAAVYFLRVFAVFQFPLAAIYIFRSAIQGLGFSNYAMFGGILELLSRTLVSILLVKPFGFKGVALSSPVAWTTAGILFIILYVVLMRRIERKGVRNPASDNT